MVSKRSNIRAFAKELRQRLKEQAQETRHFPLPGLLPSGHMLVLALKPEGAGTLSLLENGPTVPRMAMQQAFTEREISLLHPLLNTHPAYCPYELLLASFYATITEKHTVRYRKEVIVALENGTLDAYLRPLRNVLSRTRIKVRSFGIEITGLYETGYQLFPLPERLKGA